MKPIAAFLLIALFSVEASSQSFTGRRYAPPTPLPEIGSTFSEIVQTATERRQHRVAPLVASGDTEPVFIFPVVGSLAGGGGLYFKTESTIVNAVNRSQDILLFWFPVGGGSANCTRSAKRFRMDANTWYLWADFVGQVFGTAGLGAAAVVAVDSAGNPDVNARIDGFSRIWTPIPGFGGTASQSFSAESFNITTGGQFAVGLRHDEAFRTNVGIFNYDTIGRTFDVYVTGLRGQTSYSMSVDACSLVMNSVPPGIYGGLELDVTARDGRALWYGFGSSVDNVSGDNWSSVLHPN